MVFKKCEFPKCDSLGDCRCPKNRDLKEYYYFCKKHAAEYNKNWNYYSGMTIEEILKDDEKTREKQCSWSSSTFDNDLDIEFLKQFLGKKIGKNVEFYKPDSKILKALDVFDLKWPTTFDIVQKEYRKLAKKYHPDVGGDEKRFKELNYSFDLLKRFLKK